MINFSALKTGSKPEEAATNAWKIGICAGSKTVENNRSTLSRNVCLEYWHLLHGLFRYFQNHFRVAALLSCKGHHLLCKAGFGRLDQIGRNFLPVCQITYR